MSGPWSGKGSDLHCKVPSTIKTAASRTDWSRNFARGSVLYEFFRRSFWKLPQEVHWIGNSNDDDGLGSGAAWRRLSRAASYRELSYGTRSCQQRKAMRIHLYASDRTAAWCDLFLSSRWRGYRPLPSHSREWIGRPTHGTSAAEI